MIEYLFILSTIVILGWAAIEDIKNRMVPDKFWIIHLIINLPLFIYWIFITDSIILRVNAIINVIIAILFGFLLFYTGAFGGGDSKAIMAISLSTPVYVQSLRLVDENLIFPYIVSVLANMLIFIVGFAFTLFIRNILFRKKFGGLFSETNASFGSKFAILISGRQSAVDQLSSIEHEDPAEKYEEEKWKIYTPIFEEPLEDEEYEIKEKEAREKAYNDAISTNRTYLWTRPQPPGLVFLFLGYVFWIFLGSPIEIILSQFL